MMGLSKYSRKYEKQFECISCNFGITTSFAYKLFPSLNSSFAKDPRGLELGEELGCNVIELNLHG